ncbi:MAG TPA: hypothetical protein V6D35_21015 [Candidatus Sericytochromatia bacterium]
MRIADSLTGVRRQKVECCKSVGVMRSPLRKLDTTPVDRNWYIFSG